MYRTIPDFINDWSQEVAGTAAVIEEVTDEKLEFAIVEEHSTLGWLGWHLATSPAFFGSLIGVKITPAGDATHVPEKASEVVAAYRQVVEDVKEEVERTLTDAQLEETVDAMGEQVPRGRLLRMLVNHQTHHRGQMTVLLRQAELNVPGVMRPTKEDQS